MWRVTLILNALLMGVFSLGSAASQIKLRNQHVEYPQLGQDMPPLPAMSDLALRLQWVLIAMPLVWALLTLAVLMVNRKKTDAPRDLVQLHTSATLLVGVFMLGFFVITGVVPYVSIVVHLR